MRGKTYLQEFNMVYRDTNVYDYGCLLTANIIIIDHFYIALFSALEQTHCARMRVFLISTEVVYSAGMANPHT